KGLPGKSANLKLYIHSLSYPPGGLSGFDTSWDPFNDPNVNLRHEINVGPLGWNEERIIDLTELSKEFANGTIKGFAFYNEDYTQSLELDVNIIELEGFWTDPTAW